MIKLIFTKFLFILLFSVCALPALKNIHCSQKKISMLSFAQRKQGAHPLAQRLMDVIESKHTNVVVAADVTTKQELLYLADMVGPYICAIKTHIDIIKDFDAELLEKLREFAHKHNFLIIEDRKFADIGSTVVEQYQGGIYHIADWADLVIAHALPGAGLIEGLKKIGIPKNRGLLLVIQLSSAHNLIDVHYTQKAIELALKHRDFVVGVIAQEKCCDDPAFLHLTPGVNIVQAGDDLGQHYSTPDYVIKQCGVDIIIVGRGIYGAKDPRAAVQEYQKLAWAAYQERITGKITE